MKRKERLTIVGDRSKRIYKMYKSKKKWIIAPVVIATLGTSLMGAAPIAGVFGEAVGQVVALAADSAEDLAGAKTAATSYINGLFPMGDLIKRPYYTRVDAAASVRQVDKVVSDAGRANLDLSGLAADSTYRQRAADLINALYSLSAEEKASAIGALAGANKTSMSDTVNDAIALNNQNNDTQLTAAIQALLNQGSYKAASDLLTETAADYRNPANQTAADTLINTTVSAAVTAASNRINALPNLTDAQGYIDQLNTAETQTQMDEIVAAAQAENSLNTAKIAAKTTIDGLSHLSDGEKSAKKADVDNALTEAKVAEVVNAAQALNSLNKAKADGRTAIDGLTTLSSLEKSNFKTAISNAASIAEVDKLLAEAKDLEALNKTRAAAIKEIEAANYLTALQTANYKNAVSNAATEAQIEKILEEVRNLAPSDVVLIYRAYNRNNGGHLFTADKAEYDRVVSLGWDAEGVAFHMAVSGIPVYRLYNPNSGEHFYTTNLAEYNYVADAGWRREGIAFYAADAASGVPVYRLFNPNATGPGSHHYTKTRSEVNWLVGLGWKDEGTAFFAMP